MCGTDVARDTGKRSRLPKLAPALRISQQERQPLPLPKPGSYTTILLPNKPGERSLFYTASRGEQSKLLEALPQREVAELLVEQFFVE